MCLSPAISQKTHRRKTHRRSRNCMAGRMVVLAETFDPKMRQARESNEKTPHNMVRTIDIFHSDVKRFQSVGVRQRLRQQRMLCIYLLVFQFVVVYLCIAESAWKVRKQRNEQNLRRLNRQAVSQHQDALQATASFDPCYGHLCT